MHEHGPVRHEKAFVPAVVGLHRPIRRSFAIGHVQRGDRDPHLPSRPLSPIVYQRVRRQHYARATDAFHRQFGPRIGDRDRTRRTHGGHLRPQQTPSLIRQRNPRNIGEVRVIRVSQIQHIAVTRRRGQFEAAIGGS